MATGSPTSSARVRVCAVAAQCRQRAARHVQLRDGPHSHARWGAPWQEQQPEEGGARIQRPSQAALPALVAPPALPAHAASLLCVCALAPSIHAHGRILSFFLVCARCRQLPRQEVRGRLALGRPGNRVRQGALRWAALGCCSVVLRRAGLRWAALGCCSVMLRCAVVRYCAVLCCWLQPVAPLPGQLPLPCLAPPHRFSAFHAARRRSRRRASSAAAPPFSRPG